MANWRRFYTGIVRGGRFRCKILYERDMHLIRLHNVAEKCKLINYLNNF